MKQKIKFIAIYLTVTLTILPASMQASVLYSYDFSGSGDMNGKTLNGQTWYGGGISANGTYSLANDGQGYESFGWQLQSGYIYDFKVDINQTSGNWAGIGIATSFGIWSMVDKANTAATILTTGQTWGGGSYQESSLLSGSGTYRINVDTTGANWTTSFFKGDFQVGTTRVWSGEAPFGPGDNGGYALLGLVGYGNGVATAGTFSNLELSAIPEPSALALVGTIGAILALRRSRKQGAGTAI